MTPPLLPDVTDAVTGPHWAGTAEHRIRVQRCEHCGRLRWAPAELCPHCLAPGGTWTDVAPTGTVWSYAVYLRAMHPAFAAEVPYTVAVIDLDDGVRMSGVVRTPTSDADADGGVRVGDRVDAEFETVTDEATGAQATLVRWQPRSEQGPASAASTQSTSQEGTP